VGEETEEGEEIYFFRNIWESTRNWFILAALHAPDKNRLISKATS